MYKFNKLYKLYKLYQNWRWLLHHEFEGAEKQYNLRKWAQIIKECKSSGEKVMDWIKSHNISKDKYYYWQRRLKDAYMDSNMQQGPAFVELTVAEEDNTTALTVKGTCSNGIHKRTETKDCNQDTGAVIEYRGIAIRISRIYKKSHGGSIRC